jgi:hypothetical protein
LLGLEHTRHWFQSQAHLIAFFACILLGLICGGPLGAMVAVMPGLFLVGCLNDRFPAPPIDLLYNDEVGYERLVQGTGYLELRQQLLAECKRGWLRQLGPGSSLERTLHEQRLRRDWESRWATHVLAEHMLFDNQQMLMRQLSAAFTSPSAT